MPDTDRRSFLRWLAAALNAVWALVLLIPGARFVFGASAGRGGSNALRRITPLSALQPGVPFAVVVNADRWDGFVHYPPGPIGRVWLIRQDDGAPEPNVRCFQSICPHLGCGIDFNATARTFACPCHASDFDLSGRRLHGPSPRGMDELACRVSKPDEDGERWVEVRYQTFRVGVASKTPIA